MLDMFTHATQCIVSPTAVWAVEGEALPPLASGVTLHVSPERVAVANPRADSMLWFWKVDGEWGIAVYSLRESSWYQRMCLADTEHMQQDIAAARQVLAPGVYRVYDRRGVVRDTFEVGHV